MAQSKPHALGDEEALLPVCPGGAGEVLAREPLARERRPPRAAAAVGVALCAAALAAAAVAALRRPRGAEASGLALARGPHEGPRGEGLHGEALMAAESGPGQAFDVFGENFDWHRRDLARKAAEERLDAPLYAGRRGMWCVGINLLGFSLDASAGRYGRYAGPSLSDVKYFHHMGASCFRLAVTWERLQSRLGSEELDLVPGIDEIIKLITTTLDGHVIVDPHNGEFGLQHNGVNVARSDFSSLWTAIAKKWGGNDKVIFGLYNEPHGGFENGVERYFHRNALDKNGEMVEFWRQWAQAAVDAIRKTGAKNLILVPGLQRSSAAEWVGAGRWGEDLAGGNHSGNTRLAALQDPAQHLAFEVHQHMDSTFTGTHVGCSGHTASSACDGMPTCHGADWGLDQTIAWARKYNKKLMMTEISSFPDGTDAEETCGKRLKSYIQKMNDSDVFIGYQAWQFGCKYCLGDLTPQRPRNLDWYRLHDFGRPCSEDAEDCRSTRCCRSPGSKCYEKDRGWATCKERCRPGLDFSEPRELRTNWTCAVVAYSPRACSDQTEDCSKTKCCNDPSKKCYQKEKGWAVCRRECIPGQVWEEDDPAHRVPWNCTLLSAVTRIQLK